LKYNNNEISCTINLAPTPHKIGDDALRDLEATVDALKTFPFVDRFELNISCPNTDIERADYQKQLRKFITATHYKMNDYQKLFIKVSPDLSTDEVLETVSVIREMHVHGVVTTNTTTKHPYERGGASGDLLYKRACATQKLFYERLKGTPVKIIACGGINSRARLKERILYGADEIQIFTPLIFSGPRLLRELRNCP
jgi:dihydroorotate dehydrogenase